MRDYENVDVGVLGDFIPEIVKAASSSRYPVYRGQCRFDWEIIAAMHRHNLLTTQFRTWAEFEADQIRQFKIAARNLLPEVPQSEMEWRAQACRFEGFTSLTAWSSNPFVGLYYACAETKDQADGAVWRLTPANEGFIVDQDFEMHEAEAHLYRPSIQQTIENQRVHFLTHPSPAQCSRPESFEEYCSQRPEEFHLCKIRIPHEEKADLRNKIALCGIDAESLNRTPEGVARALREGAGNFSDSFDWVFGT